MKIPFDWLNEFVDLKGFTPQQLAEQISLKAFEVEEVESVGSQIQGSVVSGKILEIHKHPNADKLQVTKIQVAENAEPKQIVCGATNIQVGQIVPVALPDALVINRTNGEPLPIKVGKIRDVVSEGMLCSAAELGINADGEGIHILDSSCELGVDLLEKLNLKPTYVLQVASRSNRGDAMSLQGIARETAATINKELKLDYYQKNYPEKFAELKGKLASFNSQIDVQSSCHKIGFLKIAGIKITHSPDWIKERLELAGVKPISNVVDITNYVMLEIGQPMHAYDASKVGWQNGLHVKNISGSKNFLALDDKEYTVDSSYLTISDSDNVLALAGVIGGKESSITDSTQSIILEAASFVPRFVRQSSRRSGVSTESSRRFERGTDTALVEIALMRAAELITELAAGKIEAFSLSESSLTKEQSIIELDLCDYKKVIGSSIDGQTAKSILNKLGFVVELKGENLIVATVPSYRIDDVKRPIDLIEELVKIAGLNEVISEPLPGVQKLLPLDNALNKLKDKMLAQGYFECISSSLVPESPEPNNFFQEGKLVIRMNNPLSKEHAELRQSLLPGLLKALSVNFKRQRNCVKLFEIGKVYGFTESWTSPNNDERETRTDEKMVLSAICSIKSKNSNWQALQTSTYDFYELKGILENILQSKGRFEFLPLTENLKYTHFHPTVSALITLNGQIIGYCAKVHPAICKQQEVTENTYAFELLAEPLIKENKFKYKTLNDNPSTTRDFTIDLPLETDLAHETIEKKIKSIENNSRKYLLTSKFNMQVKLLSRYQTKEAHTFSLSYRLTFQGEPNLFNDEINVVVSEIKDKLAEELTGVSFREG